MLELNTGKQGLDNAYKAKNLIQNGARAALVLGLLGVLSACNSSSKILSNPLTKAEVNNKTKFTSSAYGVAASPRLTTSTDVKKGGGSVKIGKPYKIRGKWYYPKEEPGYDKVGLASWYGPNFHGRLTANGEVYDQYHLSAAHPTFPLPSYARVTNQTNGKSVIVRVNDRGPYAHGRIIDLSSKAADVLDIKQQGVAKVRVQYIGRAPLHGRDMAYLSSSYRENGAGGKLPGTKLASNVAKAPFKFLKSKPAPTPAPPPRKDLLTAVAGNKVYVPSKEVTGTVPVETSVKPALADTTLASNAATGGTLSEEAKKKLLAAALLKKYKLKPAVE